MYTDSTSVHAGSNSTTTTTDIMIDLEGFDSGVLDVALSQGFQFNTDFAVIAARWSELGFNVVPGTKEKKPKVPFAAWSGENALPIPDELLADWAEAYPDATPLLLPDSGRNGVKLVVVDADDPAMNPWISEQYGQSPMQVATGREGGGTHHYFQQPDGPLVTGRNKEIGPDSGVETWSYNVGATGKVAKEKGWGKTKIDLKARRNYIVAPGALHKTGRRYMAAVDVNTITIGWLKEMLPVFNAALYEQHVARSRERRKEKDAEIAATLKANGHVRGAGGVAASQESVQNLESEPFTQWCRDNPEEVSLQSWWGLATNIAAVFGENGHDLFHEISALSETKYEFGDCERTWSKALSYSQSGGGPSSYETLVDAGYTGVVPKGITCPAVLLRLLLLNARFSYAMSPGKIWDSERNKWVEKAAFKDRSPAHKLWISDSYSLRRTSVDDVTFDASEKCGPEILNLFDRRRMPGPKDTAAPCPVPLRELVLNLADSNPAEADYALDWLAFRVRFPTKPQVALTLTGVPGSGKGTFAKIAQAICAPYTTGIDLSLMESGWGNFLVNTILVVAEEISADHMQDARGTAERIKPYILAGEKRSVNLKYGAVTEVNSSAGWLILSNHELAVALAQDDRRYSIIASGRKLDAILGEKLNDQLIRDPEWIQTVVDHLYSRNLTNFTFNKPLDNAARRSALLASRTPIQIWIADVLAGENDVIEPGHKYTSGQLYENFSAWCRAQGMRDPMTAIGFGRLLPKDWEECKVGEKRGDVDNRKKGRKVPGVAVDSDEDSAAANMEAILNRDAFFDSLLE